MSARSWGPAPDPRRPSLAPSLLALVGMLACNEPAPPPAAPARPASKQPAPPPEADAPEPAATKGEPAPPDDRPPPPPLELGHAIDPESNPGGPSAGVQPGSASTASLPGAGDRNSPLPPEASAGPMPGPPPPATPDHE